MACLCPKQKCNSPKLSISSSTSGCQCVHIPITKYISRHSLMTGDNLTSLYPAYCGLFQGALHANGQHASYMLVVTRDKGTHSTQRTVGLCREPCTRMGSMASRE